MTLLDTASRTGSTTLRRVGSPLANTTRVPSSAGFFVPRTGASSMAMPWAVASSARLVVPVTPTVPVCSQTAPGAKDPAASVTTSVVARGRTAS